MLTRQERVFIAVLVLAVACGGIVRELKSRNPEFARDFLIERPEKELTKDDGETDAANTASGMYVPMPSPANMSEEKDRYFPGGEQQGNLTGYHKKPGSFGRVNINTATQEELEALPGIGPALSARIIKYRNENGPFESVDGLLSVRGIGRKTLEKLRSELQPVE
ncbi:MAG: helix-hairpin-helix domain-containing protein [Candidatus Eisenbacteria bacterium]|nr:helix-hairpin-helix domain-containing protein [Candidatus Eisenbacteria bacterium]